MGNGVLNLLRVCFSYLYLMILYVLTVDVKQEKTHQGVLAGVEAKPKLRHAETDEKVVLPSADGQ